MNLVYLLGAGASAGAVPVVNAIQTNNNIDKFAEDLIRVYGQSDRFDWPPIANEIHKYFSFDTLAKKYWAVGDDKEDILKNFIQLVMVYEQAFDTKIKGDGISKKTVNGEHVPVTLETTDRRYYPWVLHFMNNEKKFPTNLEVLTWNYDLQLPGVYRSVTNKSLIELLGKDFEVASDDADWEPHGFPMPVYLNGCSLGLSQEMEYVFSQIEIIKGAGLEAMNGRISDSHPVVGNAIVSFFRYLTNRMNTNQYSSPLKYSWELDGLNAGEGIMKWADTLVIVGYSYPLFNSVLDKKLLAYFVSNNSNPVIYIQDKNPEPIRDKVISMIKAVNYPPADQLIDNIIPLENVNEFFVPQKFVPQYE